MSVSAPSSLLSAVRVTLGRSLLSLIVRPGPPPESPAALSPCLSLCQLSLSLCLFTASICVCVSLSLSLSLLFLSISLSLSLSLSVSLSLSLSGCQLFVSLGTAWPFSRIPCGPLSPSVPVLTLCLSLYLSVSLCISLSLSVSSCLSMSLSLSLFLPVLCLSWHSLVSLGSPCRPLSLTHYVSSPSLLARPGPSPEAAVAGGGAETHTKHVFAQDLDITYSGDDTTTPTSEERSSTRGEQFTVQSYGQSPY